MKTVAQSQTIDVATFHFYLLKKEGLPLHLCFDENRHKQAICHLQELFFFIKTLPPGKMTRTELISLLQHSHSFDQLRWSPFIREATSFQQRVWQHMSRIPFGTTNTYGNLAQQLGNRGLARAVGQACNANPLALFIPCHRVVGQKTIGGFAGGTTFKKKLLELERKFPGNQTLLR